jgi:hypothetical protein
VIDATVVGDVVVPVGAPKAEIGYVVNKKMVSIQSHNKCSLGNDRT